MAARALLVGLTGALASGKSTVLALYREHGAGTIDADIIAREVLAPGSPLLARVRTEFGDQVFAPGGVLDRARLAQVVFRDGERRQALEAIVHPEVMRREEEAAARLAAAGHAIVVADIPLLYEVGREGRFDRIVVVACPEPIQVARAVARGMSESDARHRIASQLPIHEKAARADYRVDSSGTLEETRTRALAVWLRLEQDARRVRAGLRLEAPPG